jgi:hypothetical protein
MCIVKNEVFQLFTRMETEIWVSIFRLKFKGHIFEFWSLLTY